MRVLPELADKPGLEDPADEHGLGRAARRDAPRARAPRLPQHRLRFAHALRAADGEGRPPRRARRTPPSIVYNTNTYDSVEVLQLLDGIVDVYLPDFKYADPAAGWLYSKVPDYPERSREALVEMYRQKGSSLVSGADGLLKSGLLVRMLVLPNGAAGIGESLAWIAETLSPRVAISLMAQYYPIHRAASDERYSALSRGITAGEWEAALAALEANGFQNGFAQELETANRYYRPDFTDRETPFQDVRDFTRPSLRASTDAP